MKFTDEQLQAIDIRDRQLLVSAAAGSGKTSVLVERIIRRICDKDDPVDIDRMLVMTFTKAAAAQMRDKIIRAIEAKRAEDPTDQGLIRQSALVHNARITTIHGFCLDVIRDHFQEIGLDPDFRVADEAECRLLKKDMIEKVIERGYEGESEDFVYMTECIAPGRSDDILEDILERMYDFSMSDPDPDSWLDKCVSVYEDVTVENIESQEWMQAVFDNIELVVSDAYDKALKAKKLIGEDDGPYMYGEAIRCDISQLEKLLDESDYAGYRKFIGDFDWERLRSEPPDGPYVSSYLKEKVVQIRKDYKDSIEKLKSDYFLLPLNEQVERIHLCIPVVKEIVRLTREVSDGYAAVKRDKKIVDFNDLEHMCIKILKADDSDTAAEYRKYFDEIYVDEYQDSNLVQETLLKYIARDDNLFMVGDVKQSIYSFRLARPQLFMSKYAGFVPAASELKGPGIRIDLHHNFRSRAEVLDSVNELFSQIMSRKLTGIEYDDAARLYKGAFYPESDNKKSELILIKQEGGINDKELEARVISERIHELMKEQLIFDPTDDDPNRMRPVRYSDIVILLRSAKGWDEKIKKVLSDNGIPVYVMSQTGYFMAQEVTVLLDFLTVLDNPLQDIPMAAVLRSVFGSMDDEELALIRASYPDKYLYRSVERCAAAYEKGRAGEDEESYAKKAAGFIERFEHFRDKLSYTPVYELLLEMIDGEYGAYVSSQYGGKKGMANLNMLLKKAEDYGKTSYKGLYHFVRYIEMLKKYEVDYGEANVIDENDDAVRIMTIHKSKGLEFPICFIAGMHKDYNFMDVRAAFVTDIDLGVGVEYTDTDTRARYATPVKKALAGKRKLEIMAEEERILYVAMTRAKEKLIMTGVVSDIEEALGKDRGVIKSTSYLSLLLHGINNDGLESVEVKREDATGLVDAEIRNTVSLEAGREELRKALSRGQEGPDADDELMKILSERLAFTYPYKDEANRFEKVSVTELKRRSMEESNTEDKELPGQTAESEYAVKPGHADEPAVIPDFILKQEREIPATLHGTAVHRIFELWDYSRGTSDDEIRDFIEHIKNEGLIEDEPADSVRIEEISGFVNSDLARRMGNAYKRGQLYREQPFMISLDGILIQGIIDAYFLEDDEIVIVDYKTDRTDSAEELAQRYHVQLEYYARALTTLLDRPVRELVIYSTRHKSTVNIPYVVVN